MGPASPYLNAGTLQAARSFAFYASLGVAALCASILIAWYVGVDIILWGKSLGPGMKANTALGLCLLAVGTALAARSERFTASTRWLGAVAAVIGAATLVEYLGGVDLKIGELLVEDYSSVGNSHPGRMAPLSALAIVVLFAALALLRQRGFLFWVQQACAVSAFVCGMLGTIGLIHDLHFLTSLGTGLATMFASTAVSLALLGTALLAIEPDRGLMRILLANRAGGRFARRMLPIAITFPIAVGWLRMLGQGAGYYDTSFGILIMVLSSIFVFSGVAIMSARELNRSEEALLDAQQALERRVQERTHDLEATVARLRAEIVLREAAESSQAQAQAALRSAIDDAPIGMALVGLDGRWQRVNRALCSIVGYDEASLLARTFQDITHPEDLDTDLALVARLVAGEIPSYQMEKRYIRADGEHVWVMLSVSLVRNGDGKPLFFVSQIEDISRRRQAEQEIAAGRQFLGDVINSIPIPLTVKNDQGRVIIANSAMAAFHGRAAEDIVGQTDAEMFSAERAAAFRAEDEALLRTGIPLVEEQMFATIVGEPRWVIKRKNRILLSDGGRCVLTTLLDITGRKRAEVALRDSEERFRSLTVLSTDWYWEQDKDYRFTVQSGGLEAAMGIKTEEALGKTRWELPYTNLSESDWARHRHMLDMRRPYYDLELVREMPDGSRRHAIVSGEPIYDSAGTFTGYRGTGRDITARRNAEIAAVNSRKFLEAVIEAIPEPVFLKDTHHRWVLVNSAFAEMMGKPVEALIGRTDSLLFAPERVREVWAEDDRVLAEGSLVLEERGVPRPDGSPRWLLKSKRRVTLPDGSTYIVGISTDISQLKQVEEALRTSDELHRLLADNASDLISLITPAGVIEYASPSSQQMLGRAPDQLTGRAVTELIHADDAAQALQVFQKVVKTQVPVVFSCRLGKADGGWTWIETSFRAIRDNASGRTREVIGVSRDINERVQVSAALNHFKYVLDNTLDMIFIYDAETLRFSYVNEGAARTLGIPREKLIGMAPWEVRADITRKEYYPTIEPFLRGEITSRQVETVHRRGDGSLMPVEVTMQIIRRPGEVDTFISVARDLTERKKVEQMKNEFVSTVSHELRTPVTSIRGSLGLLAGGVAGKLPKQARQLVDIATSNSDRLIGLINDILDIEKIESGKMRFAMRAARLRELLATSVEANHGYAEKFSVSFDLSPDIPDVVVRADPDRVLQVMANLLSNAAKFSPAGGKVEIAASLRSATVEISVTDHGSGIPEKFHDDIFGKFSQADSSDTRKLGGSGLGLSIAKAIVEKHGCEIGFVTAPGKGTTFHFGLPLALHGDKGADAAAESASQLSS